MESFVPSELKGQKIKRGNTINVIYFLNRGIKYTDKMEITYVDDHSNKNFDFISYKDIKISFEKYLNKKKHENKKIDEENEVNVFDIQANNIIYEYIRYFNGEGWLPLAQNENILINEKLSLDNLQIQIKATILSGKDIYVQKKFENIGKEINSIKTNLDLIKNKSINYSENKPFNSIILTANPLMDGSNEFRTMNDFNIIPSILYNLFKEKEYLKYTQFGILTKKSFIEALSNKELDSFILHLICKTTYIIPNNRIRINFSNEEEEEKSCDFVNLIFEQENNYNSQFINKEDIKEILSEPIIKENIKKITLIISTQLSQDVYNIFDEFGFKNIIIQNTTQAVVDFIANVNLKFYENLIINKIKNINDIYNDALNTYFNKDITTFCCCFHEHKINCNFIKNIKNELYNDKEVKYSLDELTKTLPHFCHLKPKCVNRYPECYFPNDFCYHLEKCRDDFTIKNYMVYSFVEKIKIKKSLYPIYSACCCYDININKEDNIKHNKNTIFNTYYFTSENINDKNSIVKINIQKSYIPQYEKMIFLVGKNKDIFNVIKALNSNDSNDQYLNIYGDTIDNLKIFINVLIEYYQERNYQKENKHIILDEFNIQNFKEKLKYNVTYFIYIQDSKFIQDIKDLNIKYKIILLSEEKIKNGFVNIQVNPEPLQPVIEKKKKEVSDYKDDKKEEKKIKKYFPNCYIKYQHKVSVREIWQKPGDKYNINIKYSN